MQGVVLHPPILVVVLLPIIVSRADFQQTLRRQIGAQGKDACSRETCGQMVNHICCAHVSSLDLIGVIGNGLCKSDRAIINAGGQDVGRCAPERHKGVSRNGHCLEKRVVSLISAHFGQCLGQRRGVSVCGPLRFLDGVCSRLRHKVSLGTTGGFLRCDALCFQCLGEGIHIGRFVEKHVSSVKPFRVLVSKPLNGFPGCICCRVDCLWNDIRNLFCDTPLHFGCEYIPLFLNLPVDACGAGV